MLTKSILKEKKQLTHDVIELYFSYPENFKFVGGQFITIKIDDGKMPPCFRAYSIASSPEHQDNLVLCLKVVPNGRATNWLNQLRIGDEIQFLGPSGHFIFKGKQKKILFIGTGTGIAPFKSIVEEQLHKGNNQEMQILFGVRHIKDIFYQDLFENIVEKNQNISFNLTLSQPEDESWKGHIGRVTNFLENTELDTENTEVYICGLKAMIDSVTELLKKKGIPEANIHFEKYD